MTLKLSARYEDFSPGNIRDCVVESELSLDEFFIDVPLVALFVDGRVGSGRATEDGLKKIFKSENMAVPEIFIGGKDPQNSKFRNPC